jgi:predicted negative regulator of RcsB-dependent stress response
MAGRNKDSRVQNPSERLGDIKLEYRDEFGRLLSQKEAFRQLTYKFHGKGPGKKAQDKRIQKFKAEQAAKAADKTTSGTLAALQNAQRATQTAGVALAGGQLAATNAAMTTEMIRELARQKLEKKRAALLKKQKG